MFHLPNRNAESRLKEKREEREFCIYCDTETFLVHSREPGGGGRGGKGETGDF